MSRKKCVFQALALMALSFTAYADPSAGRGTWETTLRARDLNGDGNSDAFYDTELNITWLRDWNYANGSEFGSTWGNNGRMDSSEAQLWINNLKVGSFGGWRLPKMVDTGEIDCVGFGNGGTDCGYNVQTKEGSYIFSELAHMYYVTLANNAYWLPNSNAAPPDFGLANTANFDNMKSFSYWFGVGYISNPRIRWSFDNTDGLQWPRDDWQGFYVIPVHDGDIGTSLAVPEPETYITLTCGLIFIALRRARTSKRM